MKNENLLSVVIITCNRKDELFKTIESCIQNAGMPIEIIVIDNGSSDGTKEMLEEFKLTAKTEIITFYSKTNLGVSGGRNHGYNMAKSDIIFFIDDDAVIDSDKSEELQEVFLDIIVINL